MSGRCGRGRTGRVMLSSGVGGLLRLGLALRGGRGALAEAVAAGDATGLLGLAAGRGRGQRRQLAVALADHAGERALALRPAPGDVVVSFDSKDGLRTPEQIVICQKRVTSVWTDHQGF